MNKNLLLIIIATILPFGVNLPLKAEKWQVKNNIPWHTSGDYAGPYFYADGKGLERMVSNREEGDMLVIEARIKNPTAQTVEIQDSMASLRLGINTSMEDPKVYFGQFFPTMLRCEKTHLWGYFEAPDGRVLAVCSPDAVASWHYDYAGLGHRIHTVSLDLMHPLPLPERHPQNLTSLASGEERSWHIFLIPLKSVHDVPQTMAERCGVPTFDIDRTTLAEGEEADIWVYGRKPHLTIIAPSGKQTTVKLKRSGNRYHYTFTAPAEKGEYKLLLADGDKLSEALLFVRPTWSWYLQQADREARLMQQKAMQHREGWLGFITNYWARVYQPDDGLLAETEARFKAFYERMVDSRTGFFYTNRKTWHTRPQNTSWMIPLLTARYAATHKVEDLELAAQWADMFIRKFQLKNGAYKGYTALTLGSKFLQDLTAYEEPLAANDAKWRDRFDRHRRSVEAAVRNLAEVGDLGDTEGEATYEDNQAGSAWSLLAYHAITDQQDHLARSLEIQHRHECLTQAVVPDCRMRGGTLRFWEAQYDVLIPHNMMNSPHGWTMRSQFGALHLYLLTGEEYYLNVAYNAMGACAQAIDLQTGELRWAFAPDPCIKTRQFVEDKAHPGLGKHMETVLGEQWIPAISKWWRVPDSVAVAAYMQPGWSCDNDVHEHFRIMAEQFMPCAFVVERPDGTLRSWNCRVERQGKTLAITATDPAVSRVHVNLQKSYNVHLHLSETTIERKNVHGKQWLSNHQDQ